MSLPESPSGTPSVSVLAVDDHPANLMALAATLAPLGHRVVQATSAVEALRELAHEDFAVILLDVHMPGTDGFEAASLIRQHPRYRTTPIIFLTAVHLDEAYATRGYVRGAVDYVTKPFRPEVLRAKVEVFASLYVERERLRRRAELLEQRERFIGVLGHDLRSPLSSISLSAHLLAKSPELSKSSQDLAARIERNGKRMARMVEDLLDFSQSRNEGGIPVTRTDLDLAEVTRAVVREELAVTYPDREILMSASGDTRGKWDKDRYEQVVTNLVTNALEHGEPGFPVVLEVREADPGLVVLDVHNSGTPIPDAVLPSLFEPFRRGHGHSDRTAPRKGLGLGLYIVDQIARAHGGRVDVTSTPARTTFSVRWPRARV